MKLDKGTIGVGVVAVLLMGAISSTWRVGTSVTSMESRVGYLTQHAESMESRTEKSSRETIQQLQAIHITMERIDARESGTTALLKMQIASMEKQITEMRRLISDLHNKK